MSCVCFFFFFDLLELKNSTTADTARFEIDDSSYVKLNDLLLCPSLSSDPADEKSHSICSCIELPFLVQDNYGPRVILDEESHPSGPTISSLMALAREQNQRCGRDSHF